MSPKPPLREHRRRKKGAIDAAWTEKDRHQYEHIKGSALERGRTEDRAEEAVRSANG